MTWGFTFADYPQTATQQALTGVVTGGTNLFYDKDLFHPDSGGTRWSGYNSFKWPNPDDFPAGHMPRKDAVLWCPKLIRYDDNTLSYFTRPFFYETGLDSTAVEHPNTPWNIIPLTREPKNTVTVYPNYIELYDIDIFQYVLGDYALPPFFGGNTNYFATRASILASDPNWFVVLLTTYSAARQELVVPYKTIKRSVSRVIKFQRTSAPGPWRDVSWYEFNNEYPIPNDNTYPHYFPFNQPAPLRHPLDPSIPMSIDARVSTWTPVFNEVISDTSSNLDLYVNGYQITNEISCMSSHDTDANGNVYLALNKSTYTSMPTDINWGLFTGQVSMTNALFRVNNVASNISITPLDLNYTVDNWDKPWGSGYQAEIWHILQLSNLNPILQKVRPFANRYGLLPLYVQYAYSVTGPGSIPLSQFYNQAFGHPAQLPFWYDGLGHDSQTVWADNFRHSYTMHSLPDQQVLFNSDQWESTQYFGWRSSEGPEITPPLISFHIQAQYVYPGLSFMGMFDSIDANSGLGVQDWVQSKSIPGWIGMNARSQANYSGVSGTIYGWWLGWHNQGVITNFQTQGHLKLTDLLNGVSTSRAWGGVGSASPISYGSLKVVATDFFCTAQNVDGSYMVMGLNAYKTIGYDQVVCYTHSNGGGGGATVGYLQKGGFPLNVDPEQRSTETMLPEGSNPDPGFGYALPPGS